VAKDDHPQASIDWASAAVRDGDLTVALAGEPSTERAGRVQAILERLERPGLSEADGAMTEAFRSFADEPLEDDHAQQD
jgi:hypothetical protein